MKKRQVVFADLHTHSTASDGILTPTQIIEKAEQLGLSALALTDHDTLRGIKEAQSASTGRDIQLIAGTELSCGRPGSERSVHVLGLFVSPEKNKLSELLDIQRDLRYKRGFKILNLLREQGFNMDKLEEEFKNKPDKVIGRPDFAHYLQNNGYISSFDDAFKKYLGCGCPAYVQKDYIDFDVAIDAIHEAGGLAIIAHPGLIPVWEPIWEDIKDLPWDGIEVFYIEHSNSQIKKFFDLANERHLIATGGSDFHGDYGKHRDRLGRGGLSEEQFDEFINFAKARGIKI